LPNRGLGEDNVHLASSAEGNFMMPQALETGYGTHNLVILMGLYAVWQDIIEPALVVNHEVPGTSAMAWNPNCLSNKVPGACLYGNNPS
jgi:hypothetical protein